MYPSSTDACSCADAQCAMHSSALRARRSAQAGLLLCVMSPAVEAAYPEQAQALYAYTEEEVLWFEATYDYLEAQLNDAELAKRMLPAKKQRRCGRSATSAPAAPAVPSPLAAAGTRTTQRAACADDT